MDRGEVLRRAGRKRAVEVGERARGGKSLGALDQAALELGAKVGLEAAQLVAVKRRPVIARLAANLQPERAPDALDVDSDDPRALAAAAERRDREPREVAHLAVVALADRLADRVAQGVEVESVAALIAAI